MFKNMNTTNNSDVLCNNSDKTIIPLNRTPAGGCALSPLCSGKCIDMHYMTSYS